MRREDGIGGQLVFSAGLCMQQTAERIARHFATLLAAIAAQPQVPLSSLDLMSVDERQLVLHTFNDTAAALPALCVHQHFERQAAAVPAASCLVSAAGSSLSYGEVDARANQLAHALVAAGVGANVAVAVLMDKRPELYIGMLAVLKAGGCYVPIDHTLPAARVSFILQQAEVKLLLTDSGLAVLPQLPPVPTLHLDKGWAQFSGTPRSSPAARSSLADACYILFTSGSTGMPKGVRVPHTGVVNAMLSCKVRLAVQASCCDP